MAVLAVPVWAGAVGGPGFPPALHEYKLKSEQGMAPVEDPQGIWQEAGLQEAMGVAEYSSGKSRFKVTAWRFGDPTGAMAAWQFLRPSEAKPSKRERYAALLPGNGLLAAAGNYLLQFEGYRPSVDEYRDWAESFRGYKGGSLPPLPKYLPDEGKTFGSERFIAGPKALAAFEPRLTAEIAAFQFSTEVQVAQYAGAEGPVTLAILNFPTPQIARQQLVKAQGLPGVYARRTGFLGVVAFGPAGAARQVADRVRFDQFVQYSDTERTTMPPVGDLLISIFTLTGLLLLVCVGGGLVMAGLIVLARRGRKGEEVEAMVTLHLADSPVVSSGETPGR